VRRIGGSETRHINFVETRKADTESYRGNGLKNPQERTAPTFRNTPINYHPNGHKFAKVQKRWEGKDNRTRMGGRRVQRGAKEDRGRNTHYQNTSSKKTIQFDPTPRPAECSCLFGVKIPGIPSTLSGSLQIIDPYRINNEEG